METIFYKQRNRATLVIFGIAFLWIIVNANNHTNIQNYNVPEVNIEQARNLIKSGAVVIDVRGQQQFDHRHIPGAILLAISVLRMGIPASFVLDKNIPIIIYCNKGLRHGPEATYILQKAGYKNAVNLHAGIEGWTEAGMPIVRG